MCVNISSVKINQSLPAAAPVPIPPADSCTIDQKQSIFIKIEPPKEDSISISFKDKTPQPDTIQSVPFVESDKKEEGIMSVINDITTIGPIKIQNITIPTPNVIPVVGKDKVTNPVPAPVGTG